MSHHLRRVHVPSTSKLQFGKQRPNPFAQAPVSRFQAIRNVVRAGFVISGLSTVTAGGCGLVAGGMHGLLVAIALFTGMGVLGMMVATLAAVVYDASSAVKDGWEGRTVESKIVERGGGQLSQPIGYRGDGAVGLAAAKRSSDPT